MLNKSIVKNIKRKKNFVDVVSYIDKFPLFSWIDVNLTELCNRVCDFCPRADPGVYPNQNLHMSLDLIEKMSLELELLKYKGAVVLSGYGEPLLHPDIVKIVNRIGKSIRLEIVTNGDPLTTKLVTELSKNASPYFIVSMYDGEFQRKGFEKIFLDSGLSSENYILRDRWYNDSEDYGLKLTNRAGVTSSGRQPDNKVKYKCFYTHYSMTIDWNGDALLCVQDWNKRVKFGNLSHESLVEIWKSKRIMKYRDSLGRGDRKLSPCSNCNADGCVHGKSHYKAFSLLSQQKISIK
jgi:radical SAM protein with 4Fe4S-binding SPASM domain